MKRSIFKLITGSYDKGQDEQEFLDPNEDEDEDIFMPKTNNQDEAPETEGQLTIDVYQTNDEMVIKSTVAGVTQSNLDITITNDMVTIRGERERDEEIDAEDYYYQELYWGPFSRSVVLPHEIDTEGAKASLKDGVLTIRLPKLERSKTKKLKVS